VKLYSYWRSSSSWRVRIALALKHITYEYVAVNLLGTEQQSRHHLERNPFAQVPVLEWEAEGRIHRLTQSMAILEYLEERTPEPPLLPPDAVERACVRSVAEMVNAGIQPIQNLAVAQYVAEHSELTRKAWSAHWVGQGLTALEQVVAATAGTYAVGDHVTIADCCIIPQLYNARRCTVAVEQFPTLTRIEGACGKLPAFVRAHPDQQPDAAKPS
jgi:maleylpyruvate isomerase